MSCGSASVVLLSADIVPFVLSPFSFISPLLPFNFLLPLTLSFPKPATCVSCHGEVSWGRE